MICDVSHDKNLRVNLRILFFGGKQTKLMFKHRESETAPISAICLFNSRAKTAIDLRIRKTFITIQSLLLHTNYFIIKEQGCLEKT